MSTMHNNMIKVPAFMKCFNETFEKSTVKDIEKFSKKIGTCKAWMISSDYVFNDAHRNFDVASFTLIPLIKDPAILKAEIAAAVPKDLKDRKSVTDKFIKLLQSNNQFHIVVAFPKCFMLGHGKDSEDKNVVEVLDSWINGIRELCENVKGGEATYKTVAESLLQLKKEYIGEKRISKRPLIREMICVVCLAAYIVACLHKSTDAKMIIWSPDRDPMMGMVHGEFGRYFPQVFLTLAQGYVRKLPQKYASGFVDFVCTLPPSAGVVWADEFNRLADYFAGLFARIDLSKEQQEDCLHKLLVKYVVENPCVAVIGCDEKGARRLEFSLSGQAG